MKKISFVLILLAGIVLSQIVSTNFVFAAPQKIAVVIVSADSDFKSKNFIKRIKENFGKKNVNVTILAGDEVQSKYQEYWFDKDLLEEGTPTKEDFIKFVSYGDYDKVIYLMIKTPDVSHSQTGAIMGGNTTPLPATGTVNSGTVAYFNSFSTSVTVNSFLADKEKIIKTNSSTNSNTADQAIWAKENAFKRCVKAVSEIFNPLL